MTGTGAFDFAVLGSPTVFRHTDRVTFSQPSDSSSSAGSYRPPVRPRSSPKRSPVKAAVATAVAAGDVLKLQTEVAQAIAQQVRAELTPQQQAQLRSARPVNPEAYDAYVRGRYYFTNDFDKPDKLKIAKSYFEQSIRKDPDFALAYSGLADSYVYLAFYGGMSPAAAYKSAEEALRHALQLDDSIGEVYDTLGSLSWRFEWDWNAAERNFE